ncbi:hypothetical protein [Agrobacterium pusense]|nr:hypothetical protein [Agrobacterium pusense]
MARGLADHHLLNELAHEVDEGLLRLGIGVLAQGKREFLCAF